MQKYSFWASDNLETSGESRGVQNFLNQTIFLNGNYNVYFSTMYISLLMWHPISNIIFCKSCTHKIECHGEKRGQIGFIKNLIHTSILSPMNFMLLHKAKAVIWKINIPTEIYSSQFETCTCLLYITDNKFAKSIWRSDTEFSIIKHTYL
jgi:hypothetical protein